MNVALSVLDDPEEWKAFSHASGSDQRGEWLSHISVQGMHCAACSNIVEGALLSVPGVMQAQVNASTGQASVLWLSAVAKPSQWFDALSRAGYSALPVDDVQSLVEQRKAQRMALWRWLVAGLCMMQVMMYALPAYVALPGEMTADAQALLRWASWVLTLPVLIFSCGPFFESAWRDLKYRRISMDLPVALGIVITFAISSAGTFDPNSPWGQEVYFDSLTMFVFFLLTGRWLEQILRGRTAGALQALSQRLPAQVERLTNTGEWESVAVRRLAVGDTVRVLPGQAFAADGVITVGATQVDEALLTGESTPLDRDRGAMVLAGSYNLTAVVQMRVEGLGPQTRFAQIVSLMDSAATQKPRIAQLADRWAAPFLVFVFLAAGLGALYHWYFDPSQDVATALMVAVAVLVVTCPCALSIATPAAMLAAAGALAKGGVLVRNLQAFEVLATADTLVFDKTGTLTTGRMALKNVLTRPDLSDKDVLAVAASLASHSLHPVSRALTEAGKGGADIAFSDVKEQVGLGVAGVRLANDANLTARNIRLGSAVWCGLTNVAPMHGSEGFDRIVYLADDAGWLASYEWTEELRSDAKSAVAMLKDLGIDVRLLSGDHVASVEKAAELLNIDQAEGGCTPDDKLRRVQEMQSQGHVVAMVGDGLNDGPVLAACSVSFAMGEGVPLAQAQSDFVVQGQNLTAVVQTLTRAKFCLKIVRQNLLWAIGYNLVCIPLAISGILTAWIAGLGMALSSLLVVANAARLSRKLVVR
ncbi:MAG: cation-translocating P-type ATPase [Betaproteobacteria bacterium]|nr:cation-translocating P-type ATPase [Betaproteobacteria bacterium]